MEDNLLTKIHTRLTAFRDEVVAKDMIVPAWVNDSIDEIEAAQPSTQRTADKPCPECGKLGGSHLWSCKTGERR